MSKKSFWVLLLALICLGANAQVKVAVLNFKAGVGVGRDDVDGISAIFGTYFINPQKFTLVERTQIDRAIAEQGFQYSSLTNNQMVRVGQILNISRMVVGDVNVVSGQYNVDVRVVNVETGAVEATDGATWARGTSYRELMRSLASRLMSKINYQQSVSSPVQNQNISKPTTVITLLGYLHVSPDEIGEFSSEPTNVIARINNQKMYGYNDWRLPTVEEWELMKANSSKLGLRNSDYMTSGRRTGIVRLVTTGKTVGEQAEEQRIAEANLAKERQIAEEAEKRRKILIEENQRRIAEAKRKEEERIAADKKIAEEKAKRIQQEKEAAAKAKGGVLINGIWWATCNVGIKGTFVSSPEQYGNYYTFDEAQNACPVGWRVPTKDEFISLSRAGNAWTALDGVQGRTFGSSGLLLFLPAAGHRHYNNGQLYYPGVGGSYWSTTADGDFSYNLGFNSTNVVPAHYNRRAYGFSLRCVAE